MMYAVNQMKRRVLVAAWLALGMAGLETGAATVFPRLEPVGDNFTFLINADPHVSLERPNAKSPQRHNQLLREFVKEVNAAPVQPAFVIFNGDIYERQEAPQTTEILLQIVKDLRPLPIAVTGNHDVRDFDVDAIFRPVQKAFNGTTNDTFSFNCGQWHFVVLPTKELLTSRDKEEAFLKWLDEDLKANRDRPTMGFMHYHLLPVGTSQLEFYTQSIDYKNRLLDVLTRYGNMKYVFSGHVHAGIKNSVKTAWEYQGVNFVVVPSPVRPRPFGEEYAEYTLDGGYYLKVEIQGQSARLLGRQIGRPAEHLYPASARKFDRAVDPRYFKAVWDLPAEAKLRNGGFEEGLAGWNSVFRYMKDKEPGYRVGAASGGAASGKGVACLFVSEEGQGWALGEFTEIYQVLRAPGRAPALNFNYRSDQGPNGGGYVWLGGFKGQEVQLVMVFHCGPQMRARHTLPRVIDYVVTAGEHDGARLQALSRQKQAMFWKLPIPGEKWLQVEISLPQAMNAAAGNPGLYESLGIDRFIIGLGAWCSDEPGSRSTAWFDDVVLRDNEKANTMQVNGKPFDPTQQGFDLIVAREKGR
jgi:3',5'-cyclic AMP phosphodiesterase CpdA